MSRRLISRRHFLGLPLTFLLAPHVAWPARGWAATTSEERERTYTADVGILYGLLSFRLDGALSEAIDRAAGHRSEEHTSELQSHSELVCRLLLEKKKNNVEMAAAATPTC